MSRSARLFLCARAGHFNQWTRCAKGATRRAGRM